MDLREYCVQRLEKLRKGNFDMNSPKVFIAPILMVNYIETNKEFASFRILGTDGWDFTLMIAKMCNLETVRINNKPVIKFKTVTTQHGAWEVMRILQDILPYELRPNFTPVKFSIVDAQKEITIMKSIARKNGEDAVGDYFEKLIKNISAQMIRTNTYLSDQVQSLISQAFTRFKLNSYLPFCFGFRTEFCRNTHHEKFAKKLTEYAFGNKDLLTLKNEKHLNRNTLSFPEIIVYNFSYRENLPQKAKEDLFLAWRNHARHLPLFPFPTKELEATLKFIEEEDIKNNPTPSRELRPFRLYAHFYDHESANLEILSKALAEINKDIKFLESEIELDWGKSKLTDYEKEILTARHLEQLQPKIEEAYHIKQVIIDRLNLIPRGQLEVIFNSH